MQYDHVTTATDEESTEQSQTETTDGTQPPMDERPEWLPEKFNSPEDLAKAYSELEHKQSSEVSSETGEQTGESEVPSLNEQKLNDLSDAWRNQDFTFTDEQYNELEKMGLPKAFVDRYAEGQKAVAEAQANQLMSIVGGQEAYQAMAEWAQQSLSQAEIEAFDKALEVNPETARMAIQGLHAQYTKAVGKSPELVQGNQALSGSGYYKSMAEVREAMKDPRYKTDSAYRESVAQKLNNSSI